MLMQLYSYSNFIHYAGIQCKGFSADYIAIFKVICTNLETVVLYTAVTLLADVLVEW